VQPTKRPISRVGVPQAAKSTIRARVRMRASDLVERLSASSIARSSAVSMIMVVQGIVFTHSLKAARLDSTRFTSLPDNKTSIERGLPEYLGQTDTCACRPP